MFTKEVKDIVGPMGENRKQEIYNPTGDSMFLAARNKQWKTNGKLGVVPYTFMRGHRYRRTQRGTLDFVIKDAIAHYKATLGNCVQFLYVDPNQIRRQYRNYVEVFQGGGCFSMVGMIGGRQQLSLAPTCGLRGTVVHEMMHALGFWHEQSRADRNKYIYVNMRNVSPAMRYNFHMQHDATYLGEAYNIYSVMQYGPTAFSSNGRSVTISLRRDPSVKNFGWVQRLAPSDIRQIQKYYSCPVTNVCKDEDPLAECQKHANGGSCKRYPEYMLQFCKKSCNACGKTTTPIEPTTGGDCTDSNSGCPAWAKRGECQKNSAWMMPNCKKSCNNCKKVKPPIKPPTGRKVDGKWGSWSTFSKCSKSCGGGTQRRSRRCDNPRPSGGGKSCRGDSTQTNPCKMGKCPTKKACKRDLQANCKWWASKEYCTNSQWKSWMESNCATSCGLCNIGPRVRCVDKNRSCNAWARDRRMNYCTSNPYVMQNCKKACRKC